METKVREDLFYAGFWVRFGATILDTILLLMITWPLLYTIYGGEFFSGKKMVHGMADVIISYIFPIVASVWFWTEKKATPGKIALNIEVLDEKTGAPLSVQQSIIRYFGYVVSAIPLAMGFVWVAFDPKKQAWHDKIAGSVVVVRKVDTRVKFEG